MDLLQFVAINLNAPVPNKTSPGGHAAYYGAAVELLGGPGAFLPYMPFSLKTLRESYAQDPHFNSDLTPIRKWDDAVGILIPNGHIGKQKPVATGGGIWPLLKSHGITSISLSEGVCLLKRAAEMLIGGRSAST